MVSRLVLFALVGAVTLTGGRVSGHEALAAPDGWRGYAVRAELAPRFWVELPKDGSAGHDYGLGLAGQGDDAMDGRWRRTLPLAAGRYYAFRAEYRAGTSLPRPAASWRRSSGSTPRASSSGRRNTP